MSRVVIEPDWIDHKGYTDPKYDTQIDRNARPGSKRELRHRVRAYTGEPIQPWTFGPPPWRSPAERRADRAN